MATLVSTGTVASANGSTSSVSVSSASATSGNKLVLEVSWGDGGTATRNVLGTPTGWTADFAPLSFGNVVSGGYAVFSKTAAGGIEAASISAPSGLGLFAFARITEWSGMGAHDTADASAITTNNTGGASTGVTVPNTGTLTKANSTVFTGLALFSVSGLTNEGVAFSGGSWTAGMANQNEANVVTLTGLKTVSANTALNAVYTWTSDSGIVGYQAAVVVYSDSAVTVGLTGQKATHTPGSVGSSRTLPATGQSVTSSAGSLTSGSAVGLNGLVASLVSGALAPSTSSTVGLAGQSVTTSSGSLLAALNAGLTGQSSLFASGTIVPAQTLGLTGQQAVFSAGTISAGNNVVISLSGQIANFSSGALTSAIAAALSGQSGALMPGNLLAGNALGLTGASITGASGSISPAIASGLTGAQSAFAAGNVATQGDVTVGLSGAQAVFACGQISVAPSGQPGALDSSVTISSGAYRKKKRAKPIKRLVASQQVEPPKFAPEFVPTAKPTRVPRETTSLADIAKPVDLTQDDEEAMHVILRLLDEIEDD